MENRIKVFLDWILESGLPESLIEMLIPAILILIFTLFTSFGVILLALIYKYLFF